MAELKRSDFPLVWIIILDYFHHEDTLECLAALEQDPYPNRTTVVLYFGHEAARQNIQEKFPNVQIVVLKENLGYAGNNNIGIQMAIDHEAEWVYLLNEDAISQGRSLSSLIAQGQQDSKIGVVGPFVLHYEDSSIIQTAGGILDSHWNAAHHGYNEKNTGQFSQPLDVDYISGCALLMRRECIEDIGLFDERFFMYWEETDWCMRAREREWRVVMSPAAHVLHKGVGLNYSPSPMVTYYYTRNRFLFLSKHAVSVRVFAQVWMETLRTIFSWSIKPRWKANLSKRDAMVAGCIDYLFRRFGERRL